MVLGQDPNRLGPLRPARARARLRDLEFTSPAEVHRQTSTLHYSPAFGTRQPHARTPGCPPQLYALYGLIMAAISELTSGTSSDLHELGLTKLTSTEFLAGGGEQAIG